MARPERRIKRIEIQIQAGPRLAAYLDELIDEEIYGITRPEVVKTLLGRAIDGFIKEGTLARHQRDGSSITDA